jgi:hypothetical protein
MSLQGQNMQHALSRYCVGQGLSVMRGIDEALKAKLDRGQEGGSMGQV